MAELAEETRRVSNERASVERRREALIVEEDGLRRAQATLEEGALSPLPLDPLCCCKSMRPS